MPGDSLSQYRILDKLGAGGMGEVYRAHDERLDRDVALKLLSPEAVGDESARKRLLREARTASALNHPNICTIFDAGEAEGQFFIAMELVKGRPLSDIVSAGLAAETVIRYGEQIAAGLAHAHEHGVTHRDLKSANVMVTPEGRVKVLDFGVAVRAREVSEATRSGATLTQAEAVAGTLPYMAPEVLQGEPAGARSDIWALGVMLYEMSSGQRPFGGRTGFEITSSILRDSPAPLPPHVPSGLRAVIQKCLSKDPGQRYQRADEVRAALEAVGIAATTPATPVKRPFRIPRSALVAIGLSLALLLAVWGWRTRQPGPPRIQSIAVLPLDNLSRDAEQEYFADGTTEALISSLAQIRALKVISRTSVMKYKGARTKSLPEIARELGVDAVVEGSVQRAGGRVRITAQLIHGATDAHLWARQYERDLADVLRLQNDVAQAIANEIRVQITPEETARLGRARPVVPEAHEAYLLGRYHGRKRTDQDLRKAIEHFGRAIRIDPSYAAAYAGLADAWGERGVFGDVTFQEAEPNLRANAVKALQLDDNLAEAHSSLGYVKTFYDWDWAGAESEYRRALEVDPNSLEAHFGYATLLMCLGRFPEATAAIGRAQERDPLSASVQSQFGRVLYRARRYNDAIAHFERALELEPQGYVVYGRLSETYTEMGRLKDALAFEEKELAARGGEPSYPARARILALMGRRKEALQAIDAYRKSPGSRGGEGALYTAIAYAALGDKDHAFQWLEKGIERRDMMIVIKTDPKLDSLRSDPRFTTLLRRMNFPE